jgi:hypothetical protein
VEGMGRNVFLIRERLSFLKKISDLGLWEGDEGRRKLV